MAKLHIQEKTIIQDWTFFAPKTPTTLFRENTIPSIHRWKSDMRGNDEEIVPPYCTQSIRAFIFAASTKSLITILDNTTPCKNVSNPHFYNSKQFVHPM